MQLQMDLLALRMPAPLSNPQTSVMMEALVRETMPAVKRMAVLATQNQV
jgi:hypothetical protein